MEREHKKTLEQNLKYETRKRKNEIRAYYHRSLQEC